MSIPKFTISISLTASSLCKPHPTQHTYRISNDNIQPPQLLNRLLNTTFAFGRRAHIRFYDYGFYAVLSASRGYGLGGCDVVEVVYGDVGAFDREGEGYGFAEAAMWGAC